MVCLSQKEKEPFLCTHCIEAKSHRRIFEKSTSYSRRFGELTHTDVCYVGIESLNGAYTMFVLFTDDATRYSAIYLLRSKADVSATFADYDRKVLNLLMDGYFSFYYFSYFKVASQ